MKRSFLLPILTVAAVLAGMVTHNIVSAQFSQEELLGCVEFGLHNQACNALDKFHDEFDYRTNGIPSASQTVSNEPINYGHLYNIGEQQEQFGGNGKRFDRDGRKIPEMSWELMGHGMVLSPITI